MPGPDTVVAQVPPRVGESSRHPTRRWSWLLDGLLLLAVTALAVWLRLEPLGPSSLWLDDAWVAVAHRVDTLAELRAVGVSAPGFVVLLRAWLLLVGYSETAAQLLPFVAGVAAPGLLYLVVVRRLGWDRLAGLAGAALLTVSPMAVEYAARVKQYTLETVLAIGVFALTVWLLDDVRDRRRWAALVGLGLLATTVSVFVAPYVAAAVAAGLLLAARRRDVLALRRGLVAGATYGLVALVWYLVALRPMVAPALQEFWSDGYLDAASGAGVASRVIEILGRVLEGLSPLPVPVTGGLLVLALVGLALRAPVWAFAAATPTVVAVVLAALELAPLGGGRTDIYLYPSYALLMAGGLDALVRPRPSRRTSRASRALVPLAVTGALLVTAEPAGSYPRSDVRPLATELTEQREDEALLVYPATVWAYALYTDDEIALQDDPASSWGFSPRFADDATYVLPPGRDDPGAYLPTVERLLDDEVTDLWLLASHWRDDYAALQEQLSDVGFERVAETRRDGAELTRWERG
jgi:hypothetical protein